MNSSLPPLLPWNRNSLITSPADADFAAPVPLSATAAEPLDVLVMVSVALRAPALAGWKVTGRLTDDPVVSTVAADPAENCAASGPLSTNGGVSVTEKPLLLVTVTNCVAEPPMPTAPKSKLAVADSVAGGVTVTEYDAEPLQPLA